MHLEADSVAESGDMTRGGAVQPEEVSGRHVRRRAEFVQVATAAERRACATHHNVFHASIEER
ncbi:hypothetical protein PV735_17600 [Streptomyces turgidiscabies]|nr:MULTISPECIES: hypothetical protein [Streptomyces]KFG05660.1 hypothetical protein IQ61_28775 [Streptomyces scabiei]KND42068.1 hypothetical protein IQ64_25660 [Streptomyces stelliscabiei]MDX3494488.1 hypothetical protein [Streptomyces turgidiscabies]